MVKRKDLSKQIAACIVVIAFIILTFFMFTKENEHRIMEQNMEYIQDSTIQMARQIDYVLSDGYESIRILSAFLSQSLKQPEVDIELVRKIAQDSVFDFIEFADKDGMDHNVTGGVSDARDRKYYLDGIKGNIGTEVIFNSRATHETLLMFYSPVTFEGEIVGVLIGVYQADNKLAKLLTTTYFGEQADAYLCTPEGKVVASNLGVDTRNEVNITELAQGDVELADRMQRAMQSGEDLNFTLKNKKTGGCMTKLQKEGWFLIQIFPEAANVTMVHDANNAGVMLEMMLIIIFFGVLGLIVHFQRKERQNIEELAEERGEYKNAVLADAIIIFEVNLTKNQIWDGIWKKKDGSRMSLEDILETKVPCNYDTYIVRWADKYVDEHSRAQFLEQADRQYLCKQFEQGKSEITFDYYAESLEGEKIFARRSIYLAADKKSGDIIAYSNVKDITEQKQKENQMRQYEQMLLMIASGMYQGVRQVELDSLSTVYLSFADNHIIPYEKGDWNAWLDSQERYIHPDDIKRVKEKLGTKSLLEMPIGGSLRCDFKSTGKNANGLCRVYSTSAFKTERDGKLYINMVTQDNTAAVENEMQQKALIEDALLRAESASKAKSRFLSNMSHDIRTPMNAIIGFTTLAMTHIDNQERVQGYLEKIASSSKHLLSLINDVLDMSCIENGRIQLEETECNLSDVMHELENMLMMEVQSRELKLSIDMKDMADGQIICDRLRLDQILLNLLGNAVKFTAPGGNINVRIVEKPDKNGNKAVYEFHVKDTGIGMSEEFQKHIFEPFERERSSTVSGVQGTGLGMAITKNLVEMMGGTIEVTSKKDVGTEFTVRLPMRKASVKNTKPVHKGNEANTSAIRMAIKGKRILLVEDIELNRELACEILRGAGFLVEEAENGKEALDMLTEKGAGYYSLILMDIQMPVMNGYDATRAIRALEDKELANIPIIAMTADAFVEDRRKALESGMDSHIAKPIEVNRLLDKLTWILNHNV